MAEKVRYNNILESGRADETLTYTKYVKDESSGKSTQEMLDEKVNKTDKIETTQIADKAVTTEKLNDSAVTEGKLADGSVTTPKVADENITTQKLAPSSVTTEKINDKAVTTEKLADQSVDNSKLSPSSVTYDKLKDKSVITEKLNDRAVTTEKVEEKAITNEKLGDQSVDGRVLREANVETKHLANESVTTDKVATKSITKDKLAEDSVDTQKVKDESITNPKLADTSVSTSKLQDGSVTNEKIAANTMTIDKFDPELRKAVQAATGLPENLVELIQDVDVNLAKLNDTVYPIILGLTVNQDVSKMQTEVKYSVSSDGKPFMPDTLQVSKQANEGLFKVLTNTPSSGGTLSDAIEGSREIFKFSVTKQGRTSKSTSATRYLCYYGGNSASSMTAELLNSLTKVSTTGVSFNPKVTTKDNDYIWLVVPSYLTISRVTSAGFDVPLSAPQTITNSLGSFKAYRTVNPLTANTWNLVIS